jgi:hypothetical protein
MYVHSATCSCSVELYKQWYTSADFSQTGIFAGFFLYMSLISQDTTPNCVFTVFAVFFYICRKDQGDITFHSIGRPEIIVYLEYQSVCPIVGIGSPQPPPLKMSVFPPWLQRGGGSNNLLQVRGWGSQFGRLDRRPVTLYILSGLGGRVEKKPFTRAARGR